MELHNKSFDKQWNNLFSPLSTLSIAESSSSGSKLADCFHARRENFLCAEAISIENLDGCFSISTLQLIATQKCTYIWDP